MPVTGVTLTEVWLNSAANPADSLSFEYAGDAIKSTTGERVDVRQLANRRRLIRRGARSYVSVSLTLPWCTADQVAWLFAHVGELVCLRDHVGSKVYGVFEAVPREASTTPIGGVYLSEVSLSFDEIDFSEAI